MPRLDLLLHLLGPVVRVTSRVANVVLDREVEDTATALLQFERRAFGIVTVTNAAAEWQDTLDVFGTRGSIRVSSVTGMRGAAARSPVAHRSKDPASTLPR